MSDGPTMFGGLRLRDDFEDGEPRIRDLELAKRLGYERPRVIRELIERLHLADLLRNIEVCRMVRQPSGGRPATEYWLDERSALFVIARSETPVASAILGEVIDVFIAYRRGKHAAPVHRLLAEAPCDWDMMWPPSLIAAVCRLHGYPYEGGRCPLFMRSTFDKIHRLVWGEEETKEVKKVNPHPRYGSNHHQWLEPPARKAFRDHLTAIEHTALLSRSKREFWERLEFYYLGRPLQLTLAETGPRGNRRHKRGRR